jgi:hypothetical protein
MDDVEYGVHNHVGFAELRPEGPGLVRSQTQQNRLWRLPPTTVVLCLRYVGQVYDRDPSISSSLPRC